MNRFKIGDRVILVRNGVDRDDQVPVGTEGVVLFSEPFLDGHQFYVEWDGGKRTAILYPVDGISKIMGGKKMNKFKMVAMLVGVLWVGGCSGKNYVKDIDYDGTSHGRVGAASLDVDSDGNAILREEIAADEALRELVWKNEDLVKIVANDHDWLGRCRLELADPRLGGDGKVAEVKDLELPTVSDKKEEFGRSKGEVKVVRQEMYSDRVKAERDRGTALSKMSKEWAKERSACEQTLRVARLKHGLPAERFKSEGYNDRDTGRYIESRPAEHNLDDAYRIVGASRAPASEPSEKPTEDKPEATEEAE
jgi:hypothetical protein